MAIIMNYTTITNCVVALENRKCSANKTLNQYPGAADGNAGIHFIIFSKL